MKKTTERYIKSLLNVHNLQVQKLNKIVIDSFNEERLITEKIGPESSYKEPWVDRLSDRVAEFGGSWNFIVIFFIITISWILFNNYNLSTFDPYPFIFLNLLLSLLAAIQAPIILMSQNRQEEKDRRRSEHEYLVNLKAEIEVRNLHQKIDLILSDHLKVLIKSQAEQLKLLELLKDKIQHSQN